MHRKGKDEEAAEAHGDREGHRWDILGFLDRLCILDEWINLIGFWDNLLSVLLICGVVFIVLKASLFSSSCTQAAQSVLTILLILPRSSLGWLPCECPQALAPSYISSLSPRLRLQ